MFFKDQMIIRNCQSNVRFLVLGTHGVDDEGKLFIVRRRECGYAVSLVPASRDDASFLHVFQSTSCADDGLTIKSIIRADLMSLYSLNSANFPVLSPYV